jgi:hypothetical protein
MDDKAKISTGPNERARNESIAGTGPGIPDDALATSPPARSFPRRRATRRWSGRRKALGVPGRICRRRGREAGAGRGVVGAVGIEPTTPPV